MGIDVERDEDNLDDLTMEGSHARIVINEPITYEADYEQYIAATEQHEAKRAMARPMDMAMQAIAASINLPYIDQHITLRPRRTIVLETGEEVPIDDDVAA